MGLCVLEPLSETSARCALCGGDLDHPAGFALAKIHRACPRNKSDGDNADCPGCDKKPSLAQRGKSALKAVAGFFGDGLKQLNADDQQARLKVCGHCEYKDGDWCKKCGCFLPGKAVMRLEHCPLFKWPGDARWREIPGTTGHYQGSVLRHVEETFLLTRRRNFPWLFKLVDGQAVDGQPLRVQHPLARLGAEDGRLFRWRDKLWMAFSGVSGSISDMDVRMLLAELDDQGQVLRIVEPRYVGPERWGKNWQFFDSGGELHCVYTIRPHVVLRFDEQFVGQEVSRHDWDSPPWKFGHLRGGASPVLHKGEWYCFFHGMQTSPVWYTLGLYTFDAETLLPKRMIREPLLHPARVAKEKPVVFPCGAMLDVRHKTWTISYGHNDRECRLIEFSVSDLENLLEKIP